MNIGINSLFLVPGDVGGTEIYFRELWGAMLAVPGHDYVVFTNNENDALLRELARDYTCVEFQPCRVECRNRYKRVLYEQFRLPRVLKKHNLDVLWSPGQTIPLSAPCPQVVTIHDMQYKRFPEDISPIARITNDFLLQRGVITANEVIAISEFSRQEVLRFTRAREDNVHAVLSGVSDRFDNTGALSRSDLPAEVGDIPYILCVAHSYPHKNLHSLVQAFDQAAESIPHQLVIVGKPRLGESAFQAALTSSTHRNRVIRIPGVQDHELHALYGHADLFVLPTLYEGFGLPILEAMLSRVPVLTAKDGAAAEVSGEYAETCDPLNIQDMAGKIIEITNWSSEQKNGVMDAAYQHAQSFRWSRTAEETLRILEKCAFP